MLSVGGSFITDLEVPLGAGVVIRVVDLGLVTRCLACVKEVGRGEGPLPLALGKGYGGQVLEGAIAGVSAGNFGGVCPTPISPLAVVLAAIASL